MYDLCLKHDILVFFALIAHKWEQGSSIRIYILIIFLEDLCNTVVPNIMIAVYFLINNTIHIHKYFIAVLHFPL